jgi:hypothetical protein
MTTDTSGLFVKGGPLPLWSAFADASTKVGTPCTCRVVGRLRTAHRSLGGHGRLIHYRTTGAACDRRLHSGRRLVFSERPRQHTRDRGSTTATCKARWCPGWVPDRWACCVQRWMRRPDVAATRWLTPVSLVWVSALSTFTSHSPPPKGYRCIESHGLGSWQRLGARDGVDSSTADPTRHRCPDRIHITRWI